MAMVEFPRDQCAVGLSVYQKLREFRVRHELEWGSRAKELLPMGKRDRKAALNDQKATAVADLAAVLSGAGKGNKMWIEAQPAEGGSQGQLQPVKGGEEAQPAEGETQGEPRTVSGGEQAQPAESEYQGQLHPVSIYWANDIDQSLAKKWSDNVQHYLATQLAKPEEETSSEVPETTDEGTQARETDAEKAAA